MPIIDVHTPMFTRRWIELLRASGDPYGLVMRPDGCDLISRGQTPMATRSPANSCAASGSSSGL